MTLQPKQHKFFELIKPDHNFEFVGRMRVLLAISLIAIVASIAMLPINYVRHGHVLNFGIDFRGGSELQVEFSKDVDPAKIREAMAKGGFGDAEAVKLKDASHPNSYLIRFGAVSPVSSSQAEELKKAVEEKVGADGLKKFDFSEGGDKIYLKFSKPVAQADVEAALAQAKVTATLVQKFGRPDDNTYEVVLIGLERKIHDALDQELGTGSVEKIPSVESVGAKAIHLELLTLPPRGRAKAHLHERHETAIYVISGETITYFGERLEQQFVSRAGDFVYIPANMPHLPVNPSATESAVAVVARTDPNEQESVVLL